MAYQYDFEGLMRGDTFGPKRLQIKNLPDISDVVFSIKKRITDVDYVHQSSISNEKINVAEDGFFDLKPFRLNFPSGTYYYDIEVKFSDDKIKTIMIGKFIIKTDVTYAT